MVDRIVISWIAVYYADVDLAQRLLDQTGALPATQAAQRRLDRAHARFLQAVRALGLLQKLMQPTRSPLEIATRLKSDRQPERRHRQDFSAEAAAVTN